MKQKPFFRMAIIVFLILLICFSYKDIENKNELQKNNDKLENEIIKPTESISKNETTPIIEEQEQNQELTTTLIPIDINEESIVENNNSNDNITKEEPISQQKIYDFITINNVKLEMPISIKTLKNAGYLFSDNDLNQSVYPGQFTYEFECMNQNNEKLLITVINNTPKMLTINDCVVYRITLRSGSINLDKPFIIGKTTYNEINTNSNENIINNEYVKQIKLKNINNSSIKYSFDNGILKELLINIE